jgi:hypothetical protein
VARRSKSSLKPVWIIAAAVLVVGAFLGSQLFTRMVSEPFRTTETLNVRAYLDNANSLRGNEYKIEGKVEEQLAWSPSNGRLFSISVGDGSDVIPVLITTQFNSENIQKGQRFIFLLEVTDNGMLRTKALTKA